MNIVLTAAEVRVLGSLIEKELATPEYYPLTLNALVNACNQKSNRDPVVSFDETVVQQALDGLRKKGLAWLITSADYRVPKYRHSFANFFNLTPPDVAVLCELMLRGPQTVGELRAHAERLYRFEDLAEIETTLQGLMTREDQPLVARLPRQPGRKEFRYAHLLAGEPPGEPEEITPRLDHSVKARADSERISRLEEELQILRREFEELKQRFNDFKKQFE
jgi:hypothetical protein